MPIGNATWGDFIADSEYEMAADTTALIGSTCLRRDVDAPNGTLYVCTALPSTDPANWSPYADVIAGGGSSPVNNYYGVAEVTRRLEAGGYLFRLPSASIPALAPAPTVQTIIGLPPGWVLEAMYCVAAGTGALTLYDSSLGTVTTPSERVFTVPTPAALTMYPLPKPTTIARLAVAQQSALGEWWVVARPNNAEDLPLLDSLMSVGMDANGQPVVGATFLDHIQVVSAGSSGNLVVYLGSDNTYPVLLTIPFGSLPTTPIRLGVGPVHVPSLYVTLPTGGKINVGLYQFNRE